MSDQFTGDYSNYNSYNAGTLIQPGRRGPPPPTMTQLDQNLQSRQVLHERDQNGQYIDEKNITSHGPFPEVLNGQRPMTIVDPTYDQHIIKPPKANVTHGRIPDIEIICSEDRNFTTYPNPSEYIIKLKDIYKNVTSITLFNACIPNTGYLVDKRNNLIYFRESCCEKLVAEIPPGDYVIGGADPEVNLTMAIKKAMDNVGESTYTVIVDNLTHKFIITSDLKGGDHIFSLDFYGSSEKHDTRTRAVYPQRSIGKIIGFPRKNFLYATGIVNVSKKSKTITGNSETLFKEEFSTGDKFYIEELCEFFTVDEILCDDEMTVTELPKKSCKCVCIALSKHKAPNKFDLSSDCFVILDILELENVRSNSTPIDRAFAVVPMVFPHNTKNFVISPIGGIPPYKKYFNPPLSRLDRLTIRFRDMDGNLINFNGLENFLEFRIQSINNNGHYDPGVFD